MMSKGKVLVAMSGGVDSSVAAALLHEAGVGVQGVYMKTWVNEPGLKGDCPWQQDIEDARAAAAHLGIPFRIVNLMEAYHQRVVRYLLEGYRSGVTPNPDMMCNREIKFGALLEWAREHGFAAVATGHYARIRRDANGLCGLYEGADKNKDQSYFLALLQQEQLRQALFPIGEMTKPEVREAARRFGLANAGKKDSQGICFVGKVKMTDFLRAYLPDDPGPIVDTDGRALGRHRGLHLHTLGQRRGVGVASPFANRAYVVVAKRPATNELVMALDSPSAPGLYATECTVGSVSFPGTAVEPPQELLVRPRYRARPVLAEVSSCPDGRWTVRFAEPQRALTPGQIAAFYSGEQLVAGSVIESVAANSATHPTSNLCCNQ